MTTISLLLISKITAVSSSSAIFRISFSKSATKGLKEASTISKSTSACRIATLAVFNMALPKEVLGL